MTQNKPKTILPKTDLSTAMNYSQVSQPFLVYFQNDNHNSVVEEVPKVQKPYFRSVRGYISGSKQVGDICRTCYRAILNQNYTKLFDKNNEEQSQKLRLMLKQLMPNIDFNIYSNPVMCHKCVQNLTNSYEFQTKCFSTENKLNNWIIQRSQIQNSDVNLLILVDGSTDEDDVVELNDRPPDDGDDVIKSNGPPQSVIEHNYAALTPKPKKKFSYKVSLSGEEMSKKVIKYRGNGPFLCHLCGRFIKYRRSFVLHLTFHKEKTHRRLYRCTDCNYETKKPSLLKQHSRTHAQASHKCSLCEKCFKSEKAVELHVRNIHMGLTDFVICHICGKEFKYKSSLRMHLQTHNSECFPKYGCETCGKRFKSRSSCLKHSHLHKNISYVCDICGKILKHQDNLRKHCEIFHENKGKYRCVICNKGYWKEEDLTRHHIRIHESGNDIKCDICNDYFFTKETLISHLSQCHGKTYDCGICGKKLKYERSLRTHHEIFHGNRGKYKCDTCDKGYWKLEDLVKHQFKIHKIEAVEDEEIEFYTDKENVLVDNFGFSLQ